MWLDRFSGQSTPAGATTPSRPYSPSPRKQSHLSAAPRPGLELNNNASNVSLSSTSKATGGSSLRNEQKPPPDVPDPLKVLRSILGTQPGRDSHAAGTPYALITAEKSHINFRGLSLEDFAQQDATPTRKLSSDLAMSVNASGSRKKYEDFHKSISESDEVLKSVEEYLTNFKAELGQVSAEIENLQARSTQLTTRLENRRKVEKLLGPAVEDISVSPITVRAIAEGPIDESFIRALNEVEARTTIIETKSKSPDSIKALEDVKPLLADLKSKAIERIRDYLVSQIKALRSPNINAQVIQQQAFLKYKDLYSFLARHNETLAEEISLAYINTMKWYYSSHFGRYLQALEKIQLHVIDQYDLMGAEAAAPRRNVLGASKAPLPQHDAFGLGKRGEVLRSATEPALPSYAAEDSKASHYLETPFRNFNQALIDNVCSEYSVATELFATSSYHQVSRKVADIFEPTFALGHALTKQLVENTTDCLGVLICVRLSQHFAFELQKRKVPVADSYINYTNILLWPRFQMVMDQHRESLKKVPTSTNRGAAAAFTLVGGNDSSKASVAPHAITQRFGQFLQSILQLSSEAGDDEPVANSLGRLCQEYEALMTKMAKGVGDSSKRGKFLYNNYSLVLTIISDTQGKLAEEQQDHFSSLIKESKTR